MRRYSTTAALFCCFVGASSLLASPPGWRPIVQVGDGYSDPYPAICASGDGNLHIMTVQGSTQECAHHVYMGSTDGGFTWPLFNSAILRTPYQEDQCYGSPFIMSPEGATVYAFGYVRVPNHEKLWWNKSTDGGRSWWEYAQPIADCPPADATPHAGVVGGNISVLYSGPGTSDADDIVQSRSTDGGQSWQTQPVYSAPHEQLRSDACYDGQTIHVVWADNYLGISRNSICYIKSTDGGVSWGDLRVVMRGYGDHSFNQPSMAIGGGFVHIVYEEGPDRDPTRGQAVWYSRFPSVGGPAVDYQLPGRHYPVIACDAQGCHVVCSGSDDTGAWYMNSPDWGQTWTVHVNVSNGQIRVRPSLFCDGRGRHLCFDHIVEANSYVYYHQNDILPPGSPQELHISNVEMHERNISVTLAWAWGIPPENDLAGYNVWRSVGPFAPMKVNTGLIPPSSHAFTDLIPYGHRYRYYVTAVDLAENESGSSNEVWFGGPLASADATYPSSGVKLDRVADGLDECRVFHAGDTVYANLMGMDWGEPDVVGQGQWPAVAAVGGPTVFEVFRQGNSILFRQRRSDMTWASGVLFAGDEQHIPGPPAVAAPPPYGTVPPYAYAAFPVYDLSNGSSSVRLAKFCELMQHVQVVSGTIGSMADSFPSVSCVPGDIVQVGWQRGTIAELWCATGAPNLWNDYVLSHPPYASSAPARHPFVEAFGDRVYFVWQNRQTATILRSSRFVWDMFGPWNGPISVSMPGVVADWPVQSKNAVTAWQQRTDSGKSEIWANVQGVFQNLSQTPDSNSWYPHVDAELEPYGTGTRVRAVSCLWTEEVVPDTVPDTLYEARFRRLDLGMLDGEEPPEASHTVVCGGEDPSPYCSFRAGRMTALGLELDYASDALRYRFRYLDPRYAYIAEFVLAQGDSGEYEAAISVGDVELGHVTYGSQKPETLLVDLPSELYASDSVVTLDVSRLSGDYVALAGVKLYAHEELRPGGGGEQYKGATAPSYRTRIVACVPNPSAPVSRIMYEVAQPTRVRIEVYDAAGRIVRTLVNSRALAGRGTVVWNGTDRAGRALPDGVYFCKLLADSKSFTQKLVLQR